MLRVPGGELAICEPDESAGQSGGGAGATSQLPAAPRECAAVRRSCGGSMPDRPISISASLLPHPRMAMGPDRLENHVVPGDLVGESVCVGQSTSAGNEAVPNGHHPPLSIR